MGFDIYDDRPEGMRNYLSHYGWHFNKKMWEFAVSKMRKDHQRVTPYTKEQTQELLKRAGITLDKDQLYDSAYVACMVKADFFGSSIVNETQMARYIKDVIDDEDGYDGIVFSRWYVDTVKKGIAIDWDEML